MVALTLIFSGISILCAIVSMALARRAVRLAEAAVFSRYIVRPGCSLEPGAINYVEFEDGGVPVLLNRAPS